MSKRSDEHRLRRSIIAHELNRRAGGDINKILPALDEMIAEQKENQKKEPDPEIDW